MPAIDPMAPLAAPVSPRESAGRMECLSVLRMNSALKAWRMFMPEPPVIGSTGHRKPKMISSTKATM